MVISLICGIVTGSTYAIASDEENQLVYIFPLCEEYFPTWKFIVEWGFRCSIIFIYCLAITSPSHYIIYGLLLIRLEEHRLLHSLRNVNQNYEKQEQLDLASQNIIKERLISCLKRHIHFSRSIRKILKKSENLVLPLQIESVLYFMSIVVNSLMVDGTLSKLSYWRLISLTVTAVVALSGLSFYGQKIEDLSENIFNCLINIKWYHWNDTNKKLYLMFLQNSLKPFKIKFTENISVNYKMGIELGLFIYKFELNYLLQLGPSYFIIVFLLTSITYILILVDLVNDLTLEFESVRSECDSAIVNRQDKKEFIQGITYMVTSLVSGCITGITYASFSDDENQLVFFFPLCEEYFPRWKLIVKWGFRFSIVLVYCLAVVSPSHYIVYCLLLFKVEENILLYYIKNINQNYENQDQLDVTSQNIIKQRLIFCLKRHIFFSRSTPKLFIKSENLVLPLQIEGALYFMCIVINMFGLGDAVSKLSYVHLISLITTACVSLAGLSVYGQKIEDLSDNIFNCLIDVKWYHWNDANKKLYLMFLQNSLKPFKIKFTENISVNYKMGLEIIKTFFSFISVVNQLQQKH
ncbi:hypothetical protein Zmor_008292 [Zophobas morio]|uniref:Odorant receptor n=1 Tax=Zophobas morio TaxID=2755281 RepID=A0AA38IZC7_9CUCU|nr:hypothetical protein Zmor_008292 [Zophobas morio]